MNFSFYIAKRYLFSKSTTNAINIITIIASVGVVVSTIVLFLILAGFSGLRTFSETLLNTSDPDITITKKKGKFFEYNSEIKEKLNATSNIKNLSPTLSERVFLQRGEKKAVAQLKGVESNYNRIIAIDTIITAGIWLDKEFPNTVVIGEGIAYKLAVKVLDFQKPLYLMVPKAGKGFLNINNAFNSKATQVIGAFGGAEEFRNKYIFTDITIVQELLDLSNNQISALELKLKDNLKSEQTKDKLQQLLGDSFDVKTRKELNSLYYKVINTENFIGYLIGTLITIIALFNILGSIIMMIIDKRNNIKTLFEIGATVEDIKKIFVFQGFLLTTLGMLIGLSIACVIVVFQEKYGFFMITETMPYPLEFVWLNVLIVFGTIIILGFTAAKIASSRINKSFLSE